MPSIGCSPRSSRWSRTSSADPAPELGLDVVGVEAARGEQHVRVEPEVRELLDEPLVTLGGSGERRLDTLLAHLARNGCSPRVEQLRDVRALGTPFRALGDTPP